jgi:hypothetical protein
MTDRPTSTGSTASTGAAPAPPDEPVPKLPRGRGIRLSGPQLMRIAGTAVVLVVLLVMQKPCAHAVSNFVTSFDGRGSAAPAGRGASSRGSGASGAQVDSAVRGGSGAAGSAAPGSAAEPSYEHLRPGMTDEEVKSAIERAREKSEHPPAP